MLGKREVWKLGGSVLISEDDFHSFARRANDHLNKNPDLERLYIVVSAPNGTTDYLVNKLALDTGEGEYLHKFLSGQKVPDDVYQKLNTPEVSMKLLRGEIYSAQQLRIALLDNNISAKVVTQLDYFPVVTEGGYLYSTLERKQSHERFKIFDQVCKNKRVVIVAGFGAVNAQCEPTLLGRNASDYVAAILTYLDKKVSRAVFAKDVPGFYDNFNTEKQKLVRDIDLSQFEKKQFDELLDRRVLEIIACDFTITSPQLHSGTRVWLSQAAQRAAV